MLTIEEINNSEMFKRIADKVEIEISQFGLCVKEYYTKEYGEGSTDLNTGQGKSGGSGSIIDLDFGYGTTGDDSGRGNDNGRGWGIGTSTGGGGSNGKDWSIGKSIGSGEWNDWSEGSGYGGSKKSKVMAEIEKTKEIAEKIRDIRYAYNK